MKKSLLILSLFALLGTGCNKTSSSTNEVSSNKTPISSTVSSSSKENSSTHLDSSSSIEQSSSSSESSKTPDIEFYNIKGTIKNVFSGNLDGVKVYANDVEVAVTNSDGKYEISNVAKADSYILRFVKDGYASEEKEISNYFDNKNQDITLDVDLAKTYAKFGSLENKTWTNYEAFKGSVSRNSDGMLFRFNSDNTVFTSEGRNSKLELYLSVGEVKTTRDSSVTQIVINSDGSTSISNYGDVDTSKHKYKVDIITKDNKTEVDVFITYSSLGMTNDQIIGMSFGLWSEVDKDWAPMMALDTTTVALVDNPTLYVRCDKDNYCFESTINDYPVEPEFNKEELIKGRPYNVANPTNAGNANADDLYVKVIKNESSFTFDAVGFGEFTSDEYIKLVLHTSETDGSGWKIQESDVSFLASKDKSVKKTGITDFWGLEKFDQSTENANHALVHEAFDEGYFTLSFEVDFTEIPNYSSEVEVSFFMFEFGAPGLYNADPWIKAMVVDGTPAGDPAAQGSYQVIQEKEYAFDKDALIAQYNIKYSSDYYAKFERKDDVLTVNLLGFGTLNNYQFSRLIVNTDDSKTTGGWALEATDVSFVIFKDKAYLETGRTDFWVDEANNFHSNNIETLNAPVYSENENGYWTITLDIDYTELGLNITKESNLEGVLIFFNPGIVNTMGTFEYNGVTAGDTAIQSNYFVI